MGNFISMQSLRGEIVDCRMFQIEFSFNQVTQHQLKALSLLCIRSILELLEDAFYIEWKLNERSVNYPKLTDKINICTDIIRFAFSGFELSSNINNHNKIANHDRCLFERLTFGNEDLSTSVDYEDVFSRLFSKVRDPLEIRKQLLELFSMENVWCKQQWLREDVYGSFYSCPHISFDDLYYGKFDFRIALPCLGENVVHFSYKAETFLSKVTEIAPQTHGRITLSPTHQPSGCSAYMDFFGGSVICPKGIPAMYKNPSEWIRYYYLTGVEWFNLLSPLQTSLICDKMPTNSIKITMLPSGGSTVTINKNILQTQVSDLKILKEFLYPIIYPGKSEILFCHLLNPKAKGLLVKPRNRWENIPIFDNEIETFSDRVVFKHNAEI